MSSKVLRYCVIPQRRILQGGEIAKEICGWPKMTEAPPPSQNDLARTSISDEKSSRSIFSFTSICKIGFRSTSPARLWPSMPVAWMLYAGSRSFFGSRDDNNDSTCLSHWTGHGKLMSHTIAIRNASLRRIATECFRCRGCAFPLSISSLTKIIETKHPCILTELRCSGAVLRKKYLHSGDGFSFV